MWIPNERTDALVEQWAREIVEAARDAVDENGHQLVVEVRFISSEMADRVANVINEKYGLVALAPGTIQLQVVN